MSKRRTKGDGGITQRHDHATCPPLDPETETRPAHRCRGRWQGSYKAEINGRVSRKYVYGRTMKDANDKLKVAVRANQEGTLVAGNVTVEKWMTDWLERRRKPPKPLKPQTWRGYKSKIKVWIIPYLGRHQLAKLRGAHIDAMYDAMRERGLEESTVRQTHAILKKALGDAVKKEMLGRSPMAHVDAPGTETNDRDQFTIEQAAQALRAAGDDARWWLALFYGRRQGECLGLTWPDVDFKLGTIAVNETLQTDYDGGLIMGDPKSRAATRTLPMWPLLAARLLLHWENEGRPTTGLVFHRGDGRPVDPKADWTAWRALIDRASTPPFAPLPYIALHAARNSASSLMEAAGMPDRMAAQILGHTSVKVTHKYQRAEMERIREAFEAMGDLLELG